HPSRLASLAPQDDAWVFGCCRWYYIGFGRSVSSTRPGMIESVSELCVEMKSQMRVEALGYVGVRAKELGDWASYGANLLGLQRVDKTRATMAFRMDDRKQRIIVHADGGEGIGVFGWEAADARRTRCARRAARGGRHKGRTRLARAGGRAAGAGPHRLPRSARPSRRDFSWRAGGVRAVQTRPRDLGFSHRAARARPCRVQCGDFGDDSETVAVLSRRARLPAHRLLHPSVRGLFPARQPAPPQPRLHPHRQECRAS